MKILVAEDDDLLREFLKRSLKIDRHLVDSATDGEKALDKATKNSYDVIILDIVMPIKNGLAVCKELRALGNTTPILFLTSRDSEASKVLGLDAGADDYLSKPFSYPELTARLRALTRRQTVATGSNIVFANLELDTAKRAILKNGEILNLRPKEYALLEYLILHNKKAVSRQELLEKIWGVHVLSTSNRIDVCMKNVRKILGDDAETPRITTMHNFGYRLQKNKAK